MKKKRASKKPHWTHTPEGKAKLLKRSRAALHVNNTEPSGSNQVSGQTPVTQINQTIESRYHDGYKAGRSDSIDGLIEQRDSLVSQLKHVNEEIAHRQITLGLV